MSVVTLAEAKAYLRITGTSQDTQVQAAIDAAEATIARRVGSLSAVSRTDRVPGGSDRLLLMVSPVISLTSVTPVLGTALDLTGLYLDTRAGIVSFSYPQHFTATAYDVVYQAGRSSLPNDLSLAIKELTRHLMATQRGPASSFPGSDDDPAPPPSFLIPYRVAELLAPHVQAGVA